MKKLFIILIVVVSAIYYYFSISKTAHQVINTTVSNTESWTVVKSAHGGFAFKIPLAFVKTEVSDFDIKNGIDVRIVIPDNYYKTLGVIGTSLTDWSIVGGFSGYGCSIQNTGPNGESTSKEIIKIANQSFYKTTDYDHGAGSFSENKRYVQPLGSNQCRYIEFRNYGANVGGAAAENDPEKTKIETNNAIIDNNINELIPRILSSITIVTN